MPGKNTEADYQQVLRVIGFAQAPGLFDVLGIIPILGWLVRSWSVVWTLVALVIAVRQALDYDDTLKAVIVCVIAWVVMFVGCDDGRAFSGSGRDGRPRDGRS